MAFRSNKRRSYGRSLQTVNEFNTDLLISSFNFDSSIVGNGSITNIVEVTQAEYDALTPDATTLYVIVG